VVGNWLESLGSVSEIERNGSFQLEACVRAQVLDRGRIAGTPESAALLTLIAKVSGCHFFKRYDLRYEHLHPQASLRAVQMQHYESSRH
jgi:hypothetical protein